MVPKGLGMYARYQWFALALTRSREFVTPIVIADHLLSTQDYDVGASSLIADPAVKHPGISTLEAFFTLPTGQITTASLNRERIEEYRVYRSQNNMLNG